jgi:hypothetical protein
MRLQIGLMIKELVGFHPIRYLFLAYSDYRFLIFYI